MIKQWRQRERESVTVDPAVEEAYQVFVNHKLSASDALIAIRSLKCKVKKAQKSFTLSAPPQHTHQQQPMTSTVSDNARAFYKKNVDIYPYVTRIPVGVMERNEHEAMIELLALNIITVKVIDDSPIAYEFYKGVREFPQ